MSALASIILKADCPLTTKSRRSGVDRIGVPRTPIGGYSLAYKQRTYRFEVGRAATGT